MDYKTEQEKLLFENLISKSQLAEKLGVSEGLIYKMMLEGLGHFKLGRAVRFRLSDVVDFLERRKFP